MSLQECHLTVLAPEPGPLHSTYLEQLSDKNNKKTNKFSFKKIADHKEFDAWCISQQQQCNRIGK